MKLSSLLLPLVLIPLTAGCVIYVGEDGASLRAWDEWGGPGWFDDTERIHGSGIIVEENRSLADFDRMSLAGSFELEVRAGAETATVSLTGDDNLLPHVITEVEDQRLRVRFERGFSYSPTERLTITVEVPHLERLDLAGSSDASLSGLYGEKFYVDLAGSGEVLASGRVDEVKISIAGSGEVDLSELLAQVAEISIAGSGDIRVHASEYLEASIAGSGAVRYSGDPRTDVSISGSGEVQREY